MLAPCVVFCNELEELRLYLKFLDVAQASEGLLPEGLNSNALRRYRYSTAILNIYGGLEQYIEGLMVETLRQLVDNATSYDELNERVRTNHSRLSIELLQKIDQTRFRGKITIAGIIKRLHSDLSNEKPCVVNEEPFIYHSSNFRINTIDDYFARLFDSRISDITGQSGELQKWLEENGFDFQIYYIINDLCDRRNEIAHGSTPDLLSAELVDRYIDYMKLLGTLINDAIYSELFRNLYAKRAIPFGRAKHVFNHSVVCFTDIDVPVKKSDILVCRNADGLSRPSGILEMQVDRVGVESIPTISAKGVGIKLEIRVKDTYDFFLLPAAETSPVAATHLDLATEEPTSEDDEEEADDILAAPSPTAGG